LGVVIDGCPISAGLISSVLDDVEFAPTKGSYSAHTDWLDTHRAGYVSADRRLLHEPVSVKTVARGSVREVLVANGDWVDAGDPLVELVSPGVGIHLVAAPLAGTVSGLVVGTGDQLSKRVEVCELVLQH
ncbi:MAG: hypothetical protein FWG11_06515, partial [Promicromonosporaceae bacterium]|nr:hypothetical protein [Promicromonosporaceae bacterium]